MELSDWLASQDPREAIWGLGVAAMGLWWRIGSSPELDWGGGGVWPVIELGWAFYRQWRGG